MITEVVAALIWQGETKEQALVRECQEELAVTLSVGGERFKNNIDKYGKGTAEFASEAIAIFSGNV